MFKNYIKLNKGLFLKKPLFFIFNFLLWSIIIIIPILYSLLISKIFSSLYTKNQRELIVLSVFLLLLTIVNLILIRLGGKADTLFRFFTKKEIQMKILDYNFSKENNHAYSKIVDIVEHDSEALKELLSIQIDCFANLIFYIISLIVLFKTYSILSVILLVFSLLLSNLLFFNSKKLEILANEKRNLSIKKTNTIEKSLLNSKRIRYIDKKQKYIIYLKELIFKNNKISKKYDTRYFILNEIGNSTFSINIMIMMIFIYFNLGTASVNITSVVLFFSYFLYGFNKIDVFVEFYNLYNSAKTSIKNIIKITDNNFFLNFNNPYSFTSKQKEENSFVKGELYKIKDIEELDKILSDASSSNFALGICKPDDTFITDTIANNIAFEKKYSICKINKVLNIVNLYDELEKRNIEEKYISENVFSLSEGQKQRLNIARAIYNSDGIILLYDVLDFIDINNIDLIINNCLDNQIGILLFTHDKYC